MKTEEEEALVLTPEHTLLTTGEAAAMLRVTPATFRAWCRAGKVECAWTPGGHRRFRLSDIDAMITRPHAA